MKRLSIIMGAALTLSMVASANIIPTGTTVTGSGPYTWTYNLSLSSDQDLHGGLVAPSANPVSTTNLTIAGFLTLYDFAGYIPGTCIGPTGWSCTAQNIGFTPDNVSPTDNANIVNLTWAYLTGPDLLGQPNGINSLGTFSAQSIYNTSTLVSYTARAIKNNGLSNDTVANNVGLVDGPNVPEPATLGLIGFSLIGLGILRKRVVSV